ncbi:hypothetical protein DL96DRAFT_488390 [Flagelloscypha sp. PMI_526]|nr:hypothetical protein DL96DRAFT_488390 [Flagelloscypha sp. PMI_526]
MQKNTLLFGMIIYTMALLGAVLGEDTADAGLRGITVNGFSSPNCQEFYGPWYTDIVPNYTTECCNNCILKSFSVTASLRIPSTCYLYLYSAGDCSGMAIYSSGPIGDGWMSGCQFSIVGTANSAKIICGAE